MSWALKPEYRILRFTILYYTTLYYTVLYIPNYNVPYYTARILVFMLSLGAQMCRTRGFSSIRRRPYVANFSSTFHSYDLLQYWDPFTILSSMFHESATMGCMGTIGASTMINIIGFIFLTQLPYHLSQIDLKTILVIFWAPYYRLCGTGNF